MLQNIFNVSGLLSSFSAFESINIFVILTLSLNLIYSNNSGSSLFDLIDSFPFNIPEISLSPSIFSPPDSSFNIRETKLANIHN